MSTRHHPARAQHIPAKLILCASVRISSKTKTLSSPLFSHRCALLRPYPLSFHMLHKNTRVDVVTPSPTLPSRIGTGIPWVLKKAERSLHPGEAHGAHKPRSAVRRAIIRSGRKSRAASVGRTDFWSICIGESCISDMNVRPPRLQDYGLSAGDAAVIAAASRRTPKKPEGEEGLDCGR